jgi:hypothetical protein
MPEVFERAHKLALWHVEQCCGTPDLGAWDEHCALFEQRNKDSMTRFDIELAITYAMAALRYDGRAKPETKMADGTLVKCGLWAGRTWGNVTESEAA